MRDGREIGVVGGIGRILVLEVEDDDVCGHFI